jgi:hypothetical protein
MCVRQLGSVSTRKRADGSREGIATGHPAIREKDREDLNAVSKCHFDLAPNVVAPASDLRPAGRVGQAQPVLADHDDEHIRGCDPLLDVDREFDPRRNILPVEERVESIRQLLVEEASPSWIISPSIADEEATGSPS